MTHKARAGSGSLKRHVRKRACTQIKIDGWCSIEHDIVNSEVEIVLTDDTTKT